jgi:DnaJ-class molecular chaperone
VGQIRTLYQVIGVDPAASGEAIRKAYRARAQTLHPDASSHPDAPALFGELSSAYAVLSDPVKRRAYDASLRKPAGLDGETAPRSGVNSPHFTWTNIASEQSRTGDSNGHASTDFDEMYDAFFGASGPQAG